MFKRLNDGITCAMGSAMTLICDLLFSLLQLLIICKLLAENINQFIMF